MAYNLTNFVIDRVVRAVAFDQEDYTKVLFSINQVTNPSLNVTSETAEAVDALGTPVAIFNRAKSCEFSAENALFDMNLMAVQSGTDKKSASTNNKIETPMFETIESGKTTYTLKKVPVDATLSLHPLNGDGTLGEPYTKGTNASSTAYSTAVSDGKTVITLPTGVTGQFMAIYKYEADGAEGNGAVAVTNSAKDFPKGCRLVIEVLGCDVCNQTELIYAYLIFPNFKLSSDFDWSMTTDSTHPFSGRAMQNYCDAKKELYQIIIPEVTDEDAE